MPRTDEFDLPTGRPILAPPPNLAPTIPPSFVVKPPASPSAPLAAPARLLLVALGIGGLGCALFYNQDIGLNVVLFVLLLLGAMAGLAGREGVPTRHKNLFLVLPPLLFFAVMTCVRASGLLTFWNVFACIVLLFWTAHFWAAGQPTQTGFWGFVGGAFTVLGNGVGRIVPTGLQAMENARHAERTEKQNAALPIVRGALLALPILAVFVALLASADLVFARMVENVGKCFLPTDMTDAIGRLLLAGFLTWGAAGGLAYALTHRDKEPVRDSFGNVLTSTPSTPLGFVEAMMVLGSVCSVFAAFVAIQFAYLFGGASHVATVPGMNFATYARKGFWELVAVACLTLVLVSALRTFTRRETAGHQWVFNAGGTTLVALTLVLLASAGKRMGLFEAAYGFTELRLYVDVFLFWLGAGLIFFVWTLWTNAKTFAFGGLVCACGMLVTLNLLGPDGTVVNRNFARQAMLTHDPEWDGFYRFPNASPDAVPALLSKWQAMPEGQQRKLLGASLRWGLTDLQHQRNATAWPSWNWGRVRAYHMLKSEEARLPTQNEANDIMGGGERYSD